MRRTPLLLALIWPVAAGAVTPLHPLAPPPSLAEQRALLAKPDAVSQLYVYAVDEGCFSVAATVPFAPRWPSGLGVVTGQIGKAEVNSLMFDGEQPAPFSELAAFVDKLITGAHRAGYGLRRIGKEEVYVPVVYCLDAPPVLGPDDLKQASPPGKPFALAFPPPALDKLRKLPKRVQRVAVVHGDALVIDLITIHVLRGRKEEVGYTLLAPPEP